MLHTLSTWIGFALAVLMLVDALGYTFGAIGPIWRALSPTEPYWQRRLLLNLLLANQGLYLGAAIPLVGAVIEAQQRGAARALFALTLATCAYTLVTVPLFTPRDSAHVIPRSRGSADPHRIRGDLTPVLVAMGQSSYEKRL